MVGDSNMYGKSGGMYGNPALIGSVTDPMQVMSANNQIPIGGFGVVGKVVSGIGRVGEAMATAQSQIDQLSNNIHALEVEKAYNVKNYKQQIADTLASNKISFYSSGLDINTGTARNVIESNRTAGLEDLEQMEANYTMQIKNLQTQRKEAEKSKQYAWTKFF